MGTDDKYPLALPQGTVLAGQYIIDRVLGQGGFGITYLATDYRTAQKVAVKEFFPEAMATRTQTVVTVFSGERGDNFAYGKTCFLQEAETLAEFIGNENIVRVHSYFEENQTAYFVMDFVEGISFDQYIKDHGGRVSCGEAERILLPVMDALSAVHARGIVHRDVTPDNIYITKDGIVKLLDFGAARYSLGDKSRSLDVVLKHGFAPKEQYTRRGRQGPYTDVYTIGASFYFAVTGRRPPDSIDRLEEDDLIPPSSLGVDIPTEKEDAILKAMSVQPYERFQSMGEFRQALLGAADAEDPAAMRQTPLQQDPTQQRIFDVPAVQPRTSAQYSDPAQCQNTAQYSDPAQCQNTAQYSDPAQCQNTAQYGDPAQYIQEAGHGRTGIALKKEWLLPAGIGVGAVSLIVLMIMTLLISGAGPDDEEAANYSLADSRESGGSSVIGNDGSIDFGNDGSIDFGIGGIDFGIGGSISIEMPTVQPEPEPEQMPVSPRVEILGNTPNNIMNYGQFLYDGENIFLAYPKGGGLMCISGDGEPVFLDEDGYIRCISIVDDKIYYINTGLAYQMDRNGANREPIPELTDFSGIATLHVSEDYYYIDCGELWCIERNSGETVGYLDILRYGSDFTFLKGYVYYLEKTDKNGNNLLRVPADALDTPEKELLLGPDDIHYCYSIVAEGNYIYGMYQKTDAHEIAFFQYDVETDAIVCTYTFTGWEGRFYLKNVCDRYVYFAFESYSPEEGYDDPMIYRFEADPGDGSFEPQLVYEFSEGQSLKYLSVCEEGQIIILTTYGGGSHAQILVDMDGSGEPVIIEVTD